MQSFLETIRAKYHLPGLAAAVMKQGQVTVNVCGIRKADDPTLITPQDKFHFGSCSKSVTAALVHLLIDEGRLDLKTTMAQILPNWIMDASYHDATIAQLLTHTAGLPRDFSAPEIIRKQEETILWHQVRKESVQEVLAHSVAGSRAYSYSNLGYILLGCIIEILTGDIFEKHAQEKIFTPLGMTSAGFGVPDKTGDVSQPWGHEHGEDHVLEPVNSDNPAAYAPAGTMHANVADWMKFVAFLLGRIKRDRDYFSVPDEPGYRYTEHGLIETPTDLWHNGSNNLNYAQQVLLVQKNAALIVTTNDSSPFAHKAVDEMTDYILAQMTVK